MRTDQKNPQIALFSAAFFTLAFASCGGSEPNPRNQKPTPPTPDAAIVYVYVTPDAAPPPPCACTCVCSNTGVCACNCDCGPTEIIQVAPPPNEDAAVEPEPEPEPEPVTEDDALPVAIDDARVPTPDSLANRDATVSNAGDAKNDALFTADVLTVKDSAPDLAVPDTASDKGEDASADAWPDAAPDLPPPDLKPPCTTPTCLCPAGSICQPTALMAIPSISDYSTLGYGYFLKNIAGFGLYEQTHTVGYLDVTVGVTVGPPPSYETAVTYSASSKNYSVITGASVIFYDWYSLRMQFLEQIDACGCTGISLDLKGDISKPRPEATVRLTLADTVCRNPDGSPNDAGTGSDELWWYDFLQTDISADWKKVEIPLDKFRLGSVRYNDQKLDLRCVQAFEINYQYNITIDCTDGCYRQEEIMGSNHFEISGLTTY